MAKLTVLIGAPGAGKSTYAASIPGATVVTTDNQQGKIPGDILHSVYKQINALLAQGKTVVLDSTGSNPAMRKAAVTIARKHGANVEAHVIDAPLAACLDAQKTRRNPVAESHVRRIHNAVRQQTAGLAGEGFSKVIKRSKGK